MRTMLKVILSRLFIVAILLIIQITIILGIIFKLSDYFIYIHTALMILSVFVVLHIVNKNDEPSFKIPWIIFILLAPIFGVSCYVMFGDSKMTKKFSAIAKTVSEEVKQEYEKVYHENEALQKRLEKEDKTMFRQSAYISNTTHMPLHTNTTTEFLPLGEVYYARLLEELKKAEHFIFMEFFILTEGKMLNTIVEILKQKVEEGLDVRVMYDDLGSIFVLRNGYDRYLESLGIQCVIFNKFVPVLSIMHNNRDHRKIVVIDGYIGFTGGINLADEYINEIQVHGHWKDTGILLKGEAVKNLTLMFLESWNYFRREDMKLEQYMPHVYHEGEFESDGFVQPYGDTPMDTEQVGEIVYINIIQQANDYVYITTPYLIIDYTMMAALISAAKRGVDVKIITPHIPDKWFVYVLTQSYYLTLIQSGIKIYEYTPGFIHAKGFVCDDKVGVVGTINLDYRSLWHHFECGVWLYQTKAVSQLKQDYMETLEKSMSISEEDCRKIPFKNKLVRIFIKFLAPLM